MTRIHIVGHPFSTIGVAEQLRSHVRAALSVDMHVQVRDVWRYASRVDPAHIELIAPLENGSLDHGCRVFHINGDEVDGVWSRLLAEGFRAERGWNVIVPAWELPRYPQVWADKLKLFDEVWSLSHFVTESLEAAGVENVHHVGQSVEVATGYLLPRRHFGLREDMFCLLAFFDRTSFYSRKNPEAVLRLFDLLVARNPYLRLQLVLKVKEGDRESLAALEDIGARRDVHILTKPMSQFETHSLINACDCFVSLHRSEGFGRGTGEAMSLGRLAMATGWSGNLDHMSADNSLLVDYHLVPVGEGEYPHWENQVWAEPDIEHAARQLERVLHDADYASRLRANARLNVLQHCGNRAVGLRMLDRVEARNGL